MNRLISKGMSNIYYGEMTFSKLAGKEIYRKENLKKRTSFKEQKGTRYI